MTISKVGISWRGNRELLPEEARRRQGPRVECRKTGPSSLISNEEVQSRNKWQNRLWNREAAVCGEGQAVWSALLPVGPDRNSRPGSDNGLCIVMYKTRTIIYV